MPLPIPPCFPFAPLNTELQENRLLPPCAGLHSRMKVKTCMEMNSKKGKWLLGNTAVSASVSLGNWRKLALPLLPSKPEAELVIC